MEALTLLTGVLVITTVIGLILTVLHIIAGWKIFTKTGEKGWKILIPLYNIYLIFKKTWATKFFWICIAISILMTIVNICMMNGCQFEVMPFIYTACSIAIFVFSIIGFYRLSAAFGHGGGWTVGLIFLPTIFTLMLAFGKSEYKGNVYLENNN